MPKYITRRVINSKPSIEDRNNLIIFLRFNDPNPDKTSPVYNNYTKIARALNISPTTVRNVCIGACDKNDSMIIVKDESKLLTQDHIDFLTSEDTLKS